jgi:hypothetical protein
LTFQEILTQQEDEYEDELRQSIGAAEGELGTERETVLALRTIVQVGYPILMWRPSRHSHSNLLTD